jgi:hypothetical protein
MPQTWASTKIQWEGNRPNMMKQGPRQAGTGGRGCVGADRSIFPKKNQNVRARRGHEDLCDRCSAALGALRRRRDGRKLRNLRCALTCKHLFIYICTPTLASTVSQPCRRLSCRFFPRALCSSRCRGVPGPGIRGAERAQDFPSPAEASARKELLLRRGSSRGSGPHERLL